jgi:hypothetical protein
MKARLSVLAQDQADGNDLAFETKTIVSDIETRTAEMHVYLSRDSEITAQIQPRVEAIERMTTELLDQRSMIDDVNLIPTDPHQRERLVRSFAHGISRNVIAGVRQYLQKTYMEGLLLANLPISERHCQCKGHESQTAVDDTSACSINLPIKHGFLQQTQGSSASLGNRTEDTWLKQSRSTTSRYLINNRLLGTLKLQTTLTTYSRRSLNGSCHARDLRQIWYTKITYMPSLLCSQGIMAKYSPWKSAGEGEHFVPSFNIGLSTFNIRDDDSEIFEACKQLDTRRIQDLFDRGLASPFDVYSDGRNLLGCTVNYGVSEMPLKRKNDS